MSKQEVRHKGYTVVNHGMAGWYEWSIYAPADKGICGGVKEHEGKFEVEFFVRSKRVEGMNEILSFSADSIVEGIELFLEKK